MQLHHFTLSTKQLDAIPEPERVLIVLMSHAANELNVLSKLFHFCTTHEVDVPLLVEAQNAQALTLVRILTGKMYECWRLLHSAFFNKVSNTYEPLFDEEARVSLDSLKRYFGRGGNLIEVVRNKYAFHYSPEQISKGYIKLGERDALDVYLSKTNANTLYVFAESIVGRSLMESINPDDHSCALETLIDETARVLGWFNVVIAACLSTCLQLHIGGDLYELGARDIEVEGAPDWKSVTIPYFVEIVERTPSNRVESTKDK